jgi:hypothetical protein
LEKSIRETTIANYWISSENLISWYFLRFLLQFILKLTLYLQINSSFYLLEQ